MCKERNNLSQIMVPAEPNFTSRSKLSSGEVSLYLTENKSLDMRAK